MTQDKEPEIWADIHGFYGLYEISSWGRVRNSKLNIIKSFKNNKGYFIVGLKKQGEQFKKSVHRLVGFAFVPNPDNKPQINHDDCDKENNYYKNLVWSTCMENNRHAQANGLCQNDSGENHWKTTLKEKEVLEIRASNLSGKELSKMYGTTTSTIYHIKSRRSWKHI